MKAEHRIVITFEEELEVDIFENAYSISYTRIRCFTDNLCVEVLEDYSEDEKFLKGEIINLPEFGEPMKRIQLKKENNAISVTYIKDNIPKLLCSYKWEDICNGFTAVLN